VREQLVMRFGDERHVQHFLAAAYAMKADLARQDRLAGARHAFEKINAAAHETAAQDLVKAGHARFDVSAREGRRFVNVHYRVWLDCD